MFIPIYVYIYIYIYVYMYFHISIYIYIYREREIEREICRERERDLSCAALYFVAVIVVTSLHAVFCMFACLLFVLRVSLFKHVVLHQQGQKVARQKSTPQKSSRMFNGIFRLMFSGMFK